jgi:hypothetical protein
MALIVGAALIGFVLGVVFITEPRPTDRYTELYFVVHKVPLESYPGGQDFNFTGNIVTGQIFSNDFWILGPDTDEEVLVFSPEGDRIGIYQSFKLGDTHMTFADATYAECLLHEYPREVQEFQEARLRFVISNRLKKDNTYYYKTYLGTEVVDTGEVPVQSGEKVDVVSSFPVGTTNNEWTRVFVVLSSGENISFGFRTYH